MGRLREGPLIGNIPWLLGLLLWAISPPAWSCDSQLNAQAFQASVFNRNDLLPNGMMAIRYAGIGEEVSPHVSVHRVMMTLPGRELTIPEAENPDYLVVEVDGTVGWITYVVAAHALFYGMGQDALGFPERMWSDPEEDGLNGNEHFNGQE